MDKGLGVSNELKVAASGEMDNGFTWNYHLDLDPGASGAMVNDDAALTINTNGMGTIGFFDGEGLSFDRCIVGAIIVETDFHLKLFAVDFDCSFF